MATRDRQLFIPQAIRCFERQTHQNSELLLVDDGEQSVAKLCRGLARVRHIRLTRPLNIGEKLNIGIESARGEIIQKLDDDDYYHPTFLKLALSRLPARPSERTMVAWDSFLVLLAGDHHLRHSGPGWKAGGTFCFYRRLWQRKPFRDVAHSEDYWFLQDHQVRVRRVSAAESYLLVRHGRNTWREIPGLGSTDNYLRSLPPYRRSLKAIVHPDDLPFYESLRYGPEQRVSGRRKANE